MRVIVYGAGGIGGTIGARLHQIGVDVLLIARGAHLLALKEEGLKFVSVEGEQQLSIPVVGHPGEVDWQPGDLVLLTMKSQHTLEAIDALRSVAPGQIPLVCGQNGVANERMALRRFPNVYGMLVNLPAVHLNPGEVVTHADGLGGILDTGRYPTGSDETVESLMGLLTEAGFSAARDERIMRKKYAKLLMNLGNIVQAATVRPDGTVNGEEDEGQALGEIYRRLRREALDCFAAAAIDCASRDEVQARHEHTYRMVDLPGFDRPGGSSWQSFSRGTGNVETDYLNGEIALLGGLHGVPTPANRTCMEIAQTMLREELTVGSFQPSQLLKLIDGI